MNQDSLETQCENSIRKGSKSFFLAGLCFDDEKKRAAFNLYTWCRHCDDVIDEADGDPQVPLNQLREKTSLALNGQANETAFIAMATLFKNYQIPSDYPLELLAGMEMDVHGYKYTYFQDLKLYCYRVAGVVGLMMSHVMGLSDQKALKNACDMGMAMQLTNIARDIFDDYKMGRIYLPKDWLDQIGLPAKQLTALEHRPKLVKVVERLLAEADHLYRSGDQGLKSLHWRAAIAIQAARNIYSDIGRLVLKRRERAWDKRAFISLPRKLFLVGKAVFQVLWLKAKAPKWQPAPIQQVWRIG